jgi:hypothetical protein
MRLNIAVPENRVTKPILDAALEATTRLNEEMIRKRDVPLFDSVKSRIQWKPEPKGDEHFDHAGLVLKRGWGDCDDQAPYAAASMRASGEDRGARAVVRRSGPKRWHAIVKLSDGSYRDPSKETGMRPGIAPGVFGASVSSLAGPGEVGSVGAYIALPRLAIRPKRNPADASIESWQARADLPWHWSPSDSPTDIAMAALHASPVASQAIVGALEGALQLAQASDFVDDDTMEIGEAVQWICGGAHYEDVRRAFGPEVTGEAYQLVDGLFQKIGTGLKKIGQGIVKAVTSTAGRAIISIIPGVGPAAAAALDVAKGPLNKLAAGKTKKKKPGASRTARKVDPFEMIKAKTTAKMLKVKRKPAPTSKAKPADKAKQARSYPTDKFQKAVVYFPRS